MRRHRGGSKSRRNYGEASGSVYTPASLVVLSVCLILLALFGIVVERDSPGHPRGEASEPSYSSPTPIPGPSGRSAYDMAYDAASDRVILFGGRTITGAPLGETWAYDFDVNEWTKMAPAVEPAPRFGHAMVYMPQLERIFLFGGWLGSTHSNETWQYDFDNDTWTELTPGPSPPRRAGHAMAYDAGSGQVILFGGVIVGVGLNNETWAYNVTAGTWTQMNPAVQPSPRERTRLVYVPSSDRMVLFGGYMPAVSDETWTYDFKNDTWELKSPILRPSARHHHGLVYDSSADRVILFAGAGATSTNDTWAYHLATDTWTEMSPPSAPSRRVGHRLAYDSQSDRILLFGGRFLFGGGAVNNETWAYDAGADTWTPLTAPAPRPSARAFHSLVYHTESDRVILFGGNERTVSGSFESNGETWAFDRNLNRWTNMTPTPSPSPRDAYAMAYDNQSDRVILFGGIGPVGGTEVFSGETWAYNWSANAWTNRLPSGSPPARLGAQMAYDTQANRMILFGGHDETVQFADTWSYDFGANAWTELAPSTGPSSRAFHTMVYDEASARVVLFGGQFSTGSTLVYYNDTWTYNSQTNAWVEMNPPSSPPTRSAHAAAYDSHSDRVLMFGGDPGGDDTWAYDLNGNAWTEVDAPSRPSLRSAHGMAYDAESERTILFGGIWPYGSVTDPTLTRNRETWEFAWGTGTWAMVDGPASPSAAFTVSTLSAMVGETLTMDAGPSSDPDGSIVSYAWDFGDGATASGTTVQHAYAEEGTYAVTLTVTDNDDLEDSTSLDVVIALAPDTTNPSIVILSPEEGATLSSATVTVMGTASDETSLGKVELSEDGVEWILATGTDTWSGTLSLEECVDHTISARATDSTGNTATATVGVTRLCPPLWSDPLFIVVVAVAGVAVVVAVVLLIRRRSGQ